MAERHQDQRARMDERHKERQTAETRARPLRLTRGLKGFMDRLTGRYARMKAQNEAETYAAFERDRQEREALIFGQLDERQDLQRRIQATRDGHAQVLRDIRHDRDAIENLLEITNPIDDAALAGNNDKGGKDMVLDL